MIKKLIIIFIITSSFLYWKSTDSGKRSWDTLMLKLPLVKYFVKMGAVVQFSRTLGMLLEGGVNLSEALNIVTKIVDNKVLVDALNEAKENIICSCEQWIEYNRSNAPIYAGTLFAVQNH